MTADREHLVDELAAHALGALEPAERARVEAHVARCEGCASALRDYHAVVATVPHALAPAAPPPGARETILRQARRRPPLTASRRPGWFPRGLSRVAAWSAAMAAVACLLVWNLSLHRTVRGYVDGPQIEKLARRPARLVILAGAGEPTAGARIFAAVDGVSGHMAVTGLRPLARGRVYQLWFVPRTAPAAPAATFTIGDEGRAWVVIRVPAPLDETGAILVTEEPAPGSAAPTVPPLLEAQTWR